MKKLVLVLVLASALAGGVWSQGIELSAGGLIDLSFGGATDSDSKASYFGFGFDAFFDATYAAVSIGFDGVTAYLDGNKVGDSASYLSLGLLGKYPIALGEAFSIAPAVGFEYQIFLSQGSLTRADAGDAGMEDMIDNFAIKFGAIADYTITGNLYARAGLLGAFTLAHKDAEDSKFGVDINLGVGYRF